MKSINELTFKVTLTEEAHRLAQQFHSQQRYAKRAKQVYLNTLAIYAVEYYLKCFGLSTNWQNSQSWNLMTRSLSDAADLEIKGIGTVECCPVLPDRDFCSIPLDARGKRLAYIAVKLNAELTEASLLGFLLDRDLIKLANTDNKINIREFKPLEDLFEHLETQPTVLSQWWHNLIDEGWKNFEELFPPQTSILAFRSSATIESPMLKSQQDSIKLCHVIELEERIKVALCMGLQQNESALMDISVEVYPYGEPEFLPAALKLQILDEEGEEFLQVKTKGMEEDLAFEFRGESGDRFSVQIDFGDERIVRPFLI